MKILNVEAFKKEHNSFELGQDFIGADFFKHCQSN